VKEKSIKPVQQGSHEAAEGKTSSKKQKLALELEQTDHNNLNYETEAPGHKSSLGPEIIHSINEAIGTPHAFPNKRFPHNGTNADQIEPL